MTYISNEDFRGTPVGQSILGHDDLSARGFVLRPQMLDTTPEVSPFHRSIWQHSTLIAAKKPVVIGRAEPALLSASPWTYQVGTFVIKAADSDLVCLPEQLAPFKSHVQQIVDYEFSVDPVDAFTRVGLLLVETSAAIKGKPHRDHAKDLHIHSPAKDSRIVTPNTRYYGWASRNPTQFYTGEVDARDISDRYLEIMRPENYTPDYTANTGDIVGFTSSHLHKSPCEDLDNGPQRVFAVAAFAVATAEKEPRRRNPMLERLLPIWVNGQSKERFECPSL